MKKLIIILMIGAINMNAAIIRPGDDDNAICEKMLKAIGQVESNGKELNRHPDGVSFGQYGVTMMAVRELQRVGTLSPNFQEKWLERPEVNRNVAKMYLMLMYRRAKCWWNAVKRYHGATDDSENERYVKKVWGAIK